MLDLLTFFDTDTNLCADCLRTSVVVVFQERQIHSSNALKQGNIKCPIHHDMQWRGWGQRATSDLGNLLVVGTAGVWVFTFSSFLFLHSLSLAISSPFGN